MTNDIFYPTAVDIYTRKGYTVLPLPENAKASPPGGYTGHHGEIPDTPQYNRWKRNFPRGNTAFRPDDGLIGFDIDTYTSGEKVKDGRATWDTLCAQHGTPPPTVTSTARDPNVSGIRWYRTPKGLKWPGKLGEAIEIVQHVHRYAVVWPSMHPSTHTRYKWYDADRNEIGTVPDPEDFAELPQAWVTALTHGTIYEAPETQNLSLDEAEEWISTLADADGTMCREMQAQLERTLDAVVNEGAYDNCRDGVWAMLNLGIDGHSGVVNALTNLAQTYGAEVMTRENRDPSGEWTRIVSMGVQKLANKELSSHCWCNWKITPQPVVESTPKKEYVFGNGRKLVLTCLADIKTEAVDWLWEDRIAKGSLALVAGQPSMGKSTFVYWMVAALTNGTLHGEFYGKSKEVILCCTEDDYAATIKPRLLAAGADITKIYRVDAKREDDIMDGLNLMSDLEGFRHMAPHMNIGLVVFDPLMSRLGGKDSHKDSEVREALEPLTDVARECGFGVIGLIHFNKSGRSDPMNLLMGSAAFGAVARSVHVVMQDPDDDTGARRLLGTVKNNLGKTSGDAPGDLSTYAFTISSKELPSESEPGRMLTTSYLEWDDKSDLTIRDALAQAASAQAQAGKPRKSSKQDEAEKWLRHLFETRDSTLTKTEVIDAAKRDMLSDHNEANLARAMKRDGFHIERKSLGKGQGTISIWGLAEQFGDD